MKINKTKSSVFLLLSGTIFLMIGIGVYSFLREIKPPLLIAVFNWLNINLENQYQIKSENYFLQYVLPDMCWSIAFVLWAELVIRLLDLPSYWVFFSITLIILEEFAQPYLYGGTFDFFDILSYTIAGILTYLFYIKKTIMKSPKKVVFIGFCSIMILIAIASATPKEPMIAPQFNWNPSTSVQPGSADFTIALISPNYIVNWGGRIPEPFASYQKSLESDMLELLTEGGFTVRGPYASRDEMVFSDKEACDIILDLSIDPSFKTVTGGWKAQILSCGQGSYYYKYSGNVSMYGKINMVAVEPISGEKVWSKSVEIPEGETGEIRSNYMVCGGPGSLLELIMKDATVANPFTIMLQTNYDEVLTKCDRLIEPQEFKHLQPTIDKLKQK